MVKQTSHELKAMGGGEDANSFEGVSHSRLFFSAAESGGLRERMRL